MTTRRLVPGCPHGNTSINEKPVGVEHERVVSNGRVQGNALNVHKHTCLPGDIVPHHFASLAGLVGHKQGGGRVEAPNFLHDCTVICEPLPSETLALVDLV